MTTKERAERTLDLLRTILTYYSGPNGRQVGHTSAVLNGARNSRDSVVIVHDQRMAEVIRKLTEGKTRCIRLLEFEEGIKGHTAPIIWDNAALFVLFERCAHVIGDLLEEAAEPKVGVIHDAAHRKEGE